MANQTTLTLDDDVAEKLEAEAQKRGKTPEIVANETLRNALSRHVPVQESAPYRVNARRMEMRPGYRLECVEQLLEELDGPSHR
jgi:plasmid stability protein